MIDFNNASFFKLTMVGNDTFRSQVTPILTEDEAIISTYKGIRDGVVFTTKRIIAINVQGITGKKKDFTSMPYSKIQVYSVVCSILTVNWSCGSPVLAKSSSSSPVIPMYPKSVNRFQILY